ncbi:ATP-dependent DNA helicase DinG [Aquaspirillum sp. LM1]|uniref:ATP-dependent DNA helicase DinG n=1 Tax=Aquaspirillum sp. LM1 TaxID=1938604 RepID=UPI000983D292|nr:ATP-dependent DNA helicase DinG [Aquaspirillum sp. LM1]AQR65001.1 ATP-dependent DNA helicase DinG [Aquaspirillum sp. LM1]
MLTDAEKDAIRHHYQAIGKSLPGFRPRSAQRQMLACVAQAFARSKVREGDALPEREGESIVVVEGPTGVGKSLAYLLAGCVMAKSRGKKLVISSATIALQEQLVNRDLPFVLQHSELDASFALAKGRGRYLCPYRLYQHTAESAQAELLAPDPSMLLWNHKPEKRELEQLKRMADAFYYRRWDGDRDAFDESVEDRLWSRVTNDRHGCLKSACPNRSECPFYLARDQLDTVDIVVSNHDLLLADAAMGGGVILPPPIDTFYCIDEAHQLAKKAINQFAADHNVQQTLWWLDKLDATVGRCEGLIGRAELLVPQALDAATGCAQALGELAQILTPIERLLPSSQEAEPTWLLDNGELPEALAGVAANLNVSAATLLKQLNAVQDALTEARRDKSDQGALIDQLASELGFFIARAEPFAAVWALMCSVPPEGAPPIAKWITTRNNSNNRRDWQVSASPVSAAADLANSLWRQAAGALLTSATLRSLGSFDLLLAQTGLKWLGQTECVALESPFDFQRQGELYLPAMLASPKDAPAHTAEIAKLLPTLIDPQAPLGTLVLFTSRRQMQEVFDSLGEPLSACILVQGSLPKSVLLARHAERLAQQQASVIFGLDSFAEGLDLPGEACVQVILAKLPFAMPDDPVGLTLSQWIESRGGNPFIEITVPEASIKLIQAVGRLIRTESDYGRVTILDNRLLRQAYGKKLLAALPPFRRL